MQFHLNTQALFGINVELHVATPPPPNGRSPTACEICLSAAKYSINYILGVGWDGRALSIWQVEL